MRRDETRRDETFRSRVQDPDHSNYANGKQIGNMKEKERITCRKREKLETRETREKRDKGEKREKREKRRKMRKRRERRKMRKGDKGEKGGKRKKKRKQDKKESGRQISCLLLLMARASPSMSYLHLN